MSRWLNPILSLLIAALLSLNPVLIPLAQLATPDSMSVFLLLVGTFFAIELGYPAVGIAIFGVSILVRPENIIYAFIFSAYLLLTGRLAFIKSMVALSVAFGLYFAQTRLSHSYGWTVFFNFTFLDWTVLENPSKISTNPFDYIDVYAKEIFRMFFTRGVMFPLFAMLGIGAFLLRYDPPHSWQDPYVQLVLLAAVCIAIRTAAMPGESDRALVFPYMLIAVSFIHACFALYKQKVLAVATQ